MDQAAWQATVHGVSKESDVTEATKHAQKFTQKGHFNFHSYGAMSLLHGEMKENCSL